MWQNLTQRLDLVVWNMERKPTTLIELTVLCKENILDAEPRNKRNYKELLKTCWDKCWDTEFYHILVWC